ncbi:LysE family L-lysine exporter [Ureibacillus massiliensis 4400831 = CIP 108448 = CCUG 49529]|uniref:LysE family L-lysine exporter n=1 Tax=Ureibacillus massiliensis 4400831 = CIP 108448 = CCUG 49529 TaxID=1211035 RepID=A0A0A3JZA2_9BACL|nr:LysE family transporter [Ureibacillus massiliensis]KGR92277.1 LysE family L-lysine exporter [Ureibacillus massiliensis 4400831 = CIP 108448 = CCUG 49529]
MEPILHGIILAFGLILPLGVQNVFVFSQGVTQPRFIKALPATITASICDTILILLAVLGISMIVLQFEWIRLILLVGGILFLLYMGKVIWQSGAASLEGKDALPIKKQILFALSVSLLNPHALLDIIGVIGTSAIKYNGQDQLLFMVACIVVSWMWFFGLTISGAFLKKMQIPNRVFILFNKLSALFIWGTAVYLLVGLFYFEH